MKIKNKLNFILTISCTLLACFSIAFAMFSANKYSDITYINNEADFYKIYDNLSGNYIVNLDTGIHIKKPWKPIGTEDNPFTGRIDFNYRNIILDNGYDSEYIKTSIQSGTVNIGLFGVNKGTILHSFTQDILFCDSYKWDTKENKINLNYGTICAVNYGYITGNKTHVKQIVLPDCFETLNIGGICGRNFGQIQGCTCLSNFSVITNSLTNVGSICGTQEKEGIMKYCYVERHTFYTLNNQFSNAGVCIGLCKGGFINNIGVSYCGDGSLVNSGRIQTTQNEMLCYYGFLIGQIKAEASLQISKIVCDYNLTNSYISNLYFGFISGKLVNNNFDISISNACFSGNVSNSKSNSQNIAGLIFGESNRIDFKYDNIYFYNVQTTFENFDYFGLTESKYKDLSLLKIGLDEAVWVRGNYHFYLNYEKVENY